MGTRVYLVHFTAQQGSGEYLALIEEGDNLEEYLEPGYGIHGTFEVEPKDSDSALYMLPTGRTFKEG